ncbi:MAG TPA: hypothetical protein VN113_11615, partial [Caulobacter sp.]|nr:hypothetical protein [Caulobacter sp.]
MLVAEAPAPEHRASPKHQGATGVAIERQAVGRHAGFGAIALIDQDLGPGDRRLGQLDKASRPESVIGRGIPFVTDDTGREIDRSTGSDAGVSPDTQAGEGWRDVQRT